MEEKKIEIKQDQKIAKKRAYSPPILIVYGKLTELTAAGSTGASEGTSSSPNKQRP
jgi:hypothetical protein